MAPKIADVTPNMLRADPSLLLHAKTFPDRMHSSFTTLSFILTLGMFLAVTSSDGLFGAVTRDGQTIVTSPNSSRLLDPPLGGDRSLFLRSNLRFGDDDELQWPQPFLDHYGHISCIRAQSPKDDPLHIMWVLPDRHDFVSEGGMVGGIGRLHCVFLRSITRLWDVLLDRAMLPKFSNIKLVSELVSVLKLLLHHLEHISTTFRKMQITVRETQRVFLELQVLLDFEEIYRPRMTLPPVSIPANVVGADTADLKVCDALFRAGIPVWLLRPYTALQSIRVRAIAPLQAAHGIIPLDPPSGPVHRTIYVGSPNKLDKYIAIARYVRELLQFPDPFGCVRAKPFIEPPPSAGPSSNEAASGSRRFTPCETFLC
jgi:hypothetical protein